jgi:hypothetical protein
MYDRVGWYLKGTATGLIALHSRLLIAQSRFERDLMPPRTQTNASLEFNTIFKNFELAL